MLVTVAFAGYLPGATSVFDKSDAGAAGRMILSMQCERTEIGNQFCRVIRLNTVRTSFKSVFPGCLVIRIAEPIDINFAAVFLG